MERRGEMIVRILELRQVGRNNVEAAKKFFSLQVSIGNYGITSNIFYLYGNGISTRLPLSCLKLNNAKGL